MNERLMLVAIRDYAQNTLDGKCPDESTGLLSAIINTIDTICEGNLPYRGTQQVRLEAVVRFILCHDSNNTYDLTEKPTRDANGVQLLWHNFYECPDCWELWEGDWDSQCDDTCPKCGRRDISPYESRETSEPVISGR